MKHIIGIDPGFSGALTVINERKEIINCVDMPILKVGKKSELNESGIMELMDSYVVEHVYIEKAQAMPGQKYQSEDGETHVKPQGISSTGRYLTSYGIIRGICVGLGLPYTLVHPRTWKKAMMRDMAKEKQASIMRVNQLYPGFALPRKKDHGKADAVLIALYGLSLL